MPPLIASLLRKLALLVLMLLALSLAVFYISRLTPGDPLQSYYGDAVQSMSSAELDAARQRLGLDGPIWEQYRRWAGNVLDGDFGMSLKYKRPVVDVVLPLLGNTLLLGGLAYALVFVLAIALALLCARFEHSALDRLICRVGTTAYYVPAFWLGVLLVLRPGEGAQALTMLLGASLFLDGVMNLLVALLTVKIIRHQQPDVIETDEFEIK